MSAPVPTFVLVYFLISFASSAVLEGSDTNTGNRPGVGSLVSSNVSDEEKKGILPVSRESVFDDISTLR